MKARSFGVCLATTALLVTAGAVVWWQIAARPDQANEEWTANFAERLAIPGVSNGGRVNPRLYRGGQPSEEGLARLAQLGVGTVVNLRHESSLVERERRLVEARGMRYVSIPLDGATTPSDEKVAKFLELLAREPNERVFVHCRRGAERTGVMVAAARIAFDGWESERALAEMNAFSFRGFFYPHLKRYVRGLPRALHESPAFARIVRVPALTPSPALPAAPTGVPAHT